MVKQRIDYRDMKTPLKSKRIYKDSKYLPDLADFVSNITELDIRKQTRKHEYVMARLIYYYVATNYVKASIQEIGECVGRNHATVIHSLSNQDYMLKNKRMRYLVETCIDWLHNHIFESKLNTEKSYSRTIGLMADEIKRLETKIELMTDGNEFGVYEEHEIAYRALSDDKKEIFKQRVEPILRMI